MADQNNTQPENQNTGAAQPQAQAAEQAQPAKKKPKGWVIALIAVGVSFLVIVVIIIILIIALLVGGALLKKNKGGSGKEADLPFIGSIKKDTIPDGTFTYTLNPDDVYVDIKAKDGTHFDSITVHGLGDLDRDFPMYYEGKSQWYCWTISFLDFRLTVQDLDDSQTSGTIHPEDMEGFLAWGDSENEKSIPVRFTVDGDSITFYDVVVPSDTTFDLYDNNYGVMFYYYGSFVVDAYKMDVPFTANGEAYDYDLFGFPSVKLAAITTEEKAASTTQAASNAGSTTCTTTQSSTTTEAAAGYNPPDANQWIAGTFYSADPNCQGGSESILTFLPNGCFELHLNLGEGFCDYSGYYTAVSGPGEMDDTTVTLTFNQTTNGIPGTATVIFSDTPDYCEFMTPGFGLIGYGEPPYGMSRR